MKKSWIIYGVLGYLGYHWLKGIGKLSGLGMTGPQYTQVFQNWVTNRVIPYFKQHYPNAKPGNIWRWAEGYWTQNFVAQYGPVYQPLPKYTGPNIGTSFGSGMTPDQACASVGGKYSDNSNQYGKSRFCLVGGTATYEWSADSPYYTSDQPAQFEEEI
jgi:hypothetical protein